MNKFYKFFRKTLLPDENSLPCSQNSIGMTYDNESHNINNHEVVEARAINAVPTECIPNENSFSWVPTTYHHRLSECLLLEIFFRLKSSINYVDFLERCRGIPTLSSWVRCST